jgi:hypothetical protein
MSGDDLNLRHLPADTVTPDAELDPPTDLKIGWVANYAADAMGDEDEAPVEPGT